jgi:hypothetical protein
MKQFDKIEEYAKCGLAHNNRDHTLAKKNLK